MILRKLLQSAVLGVGVLAAEAAASRPLVEVTESIAIAAAPERVWRVVENFNRFDWHPAVASSEPAAISGARRLTLKDGATIVEQLLATDDARMVQRYAMQESPLPVTDYVATITVRRDESGVTIVTWQARFRCREGAEASDASVKEIISGILNSGLAGLKATLETA